MYKNFLGLAGVVLYAPLSVALIGGTAVHYPEVVRLEAGGKKVCTGTIIGPQTVVSAAHCVNRDSPFFMHKGRKYPVRFIASAKKAEGHDIALAVTDQKIKGASFARIGRGLKHGVRILMAGFGCTVKGGRPGSLHAGENKVIGIDEDHLLAASPSGSVLCQGDSGGPAFVIDGMRRWLVAVSSLSDVSKININVRLDSRLSSDFLKMAARQNHLEICDISKVCL